MNHSIGSSAATLTNLGDEWNRLTGRFVEQTWEGTRNQILSLRNDLERSAESYRISANGLKWSVVAKFAWEAPQWEVRVESHPVHKSLLEPGIVSGVSDSDYIQIADQMQNPTPDWDPDAELGSNNAVYLYWLVRKGITSKIINHQFVILNITASSHYNFVQDFSYGNVETILTTNKMLDETGAAITGFPFPDFVYTNTEGDQQYHYGWLKHMPSVATTTGGKRTLTAQWEYGLWPELVYPYDLSTG